MPVWQTVRLLREASLNKHQQILKHFVPCISFFLMGIVKSFVILRLHLILRILGLAMRRGRKLARDFLSRLLSSSGSLPFLSCREVAGPSFSDDSRCHGLDPARIGGKIGPAAGSRDSGPRATHELYFFATFRKILTETSKKFRFSCFLGEILHSFSYLSQNI